MANEPISGLNRVAPVEINPVKEAYKRNIQGASFETLLREQLETNNPLRFSKHAEERIDQRGIEISDSLLDSLKGAVEKARAKGAKDVVIIDSKGAFIVNIPNNIVVTTISESELRENIFTNIDSAVII